MYEVGVRGDAGKHVIDPMKQWFRDLTTPIFLKLFANPKASDWMYSYRIDWDAQVEGATADTGSRHETVSAAGAEK